MPRQLHSFDRLFLDLDTPQIDMGITPIYFYDPAGLPGGEFDLEWVLEHIDRCVRSIPVLCGKLHRTVLDLDNPYLVADDNFDVSKHVNHFTLVDPASHAELTRRIIDFQQVSMDTTLPLWQMLVISELDIPSLPKNAFVIALKVHHAVADGMTMMDLTAKLHGLKAIGKPAKLPAASRLTKSGLLGMTQRIIGNNIKQGLKIINPLVTVAPRIGANLAGVGLNYLNTGDKPAVTRFAGKISGKRSWGYTSLQMSELKQIRKLYPSCTLHDLVLTVIAGGLREYLADKNELPDTDMRAMTPVNVRTDGENLDAGNEVSIMSLSLPVQIEDPVERLFSVMQFSKRSKSLHKKIGPKDMTEVGKHIPAACMSYYNMVFGQRAGKKIVGQLGNTIVTNVPGPAKQADLVGAKLVAMSGIGPVLDELSLFHAVLSYNGMLTINITSCADKMPDVGFYTRCLDNSYEQLLHSVEQRARALSGNEQRVKENDKVKAKPAA